MGHEGWTKTSGLECQAFDQEAWARGPGPEGLGQRAWSRGLGPEGLGQRAWANGPKQESPGQWARYSGPRLVVQRARGPEGQCARERLVKYLAACKTSRGTGLGGLGQGPEPGGLGQWIWTH